MYVEEVKGIWLVRDILLGQAELPHFVVKRTKILWKEKWHGQIQSFGQCFWQWEKKTSKTGGIRSSGEILGI